VLPLRVGNHQAYSQRQPFTNLSAAHGMIAYLSAIRLMHQIC
jgi:hypothetical protein